MLNRAIHKTSLLTTLLRDIRGALDEKHGQMVDDALCEFDDDTPPSTPSVLARSVEKHKRSKSDDTEGPYEAHVSASVGSNEDLDFLDEDLSCDEGPSPSGYLGRNSQVQWMRTLQRKLDQNQIEPSDLPYAPPGSSDEAITKRAEAMHARQRVSGSARPLRDYYFYLDNERLDDCENVNPHIVPPPETAERLFDMYQKAVHRPFRVLDDHFKSQLHAYYGMLQQGTAMEGSYEWKAILNLIFAIAARFSHLVRADWRGDDRDHIVYMARAAHFLGLSKITAILGPPDHSMIRVSKLPHSV
ncbi:hypothetical protein BDU57DRAFT_461769 [Ampelomyces quisqualis]|uniref:Transcription factor domain-containing protein n=1 Tax=Ampelomyces quisqualis TaxID=50730 RepID=A0A6A5Q771_AMPQU|nr:hypothetical protein BDU57DRAFT_461769 [Ampelomyces quisqualis]